MDFPIISVESRKGGVGKTTAALNLATLLREKGYCVLLLDVDITGTSISGSYHSSYWQNLLHPVTMNGEQVNLMKVFHQFISCGSEPPMFSVEALNDEMQIATEKVNIVNSEIYGAHGSLIRECYSTNCIRFG